MPNMYIRIAQVIKSCETIPQLNSAKKYLDLWYDNLPNYKTKLAVLDGYSELNSEIKKRIRELQNV